MVPFRSPSGPAGPQSEALRPEERPRCVRRSRRPYGSASRPVVGAASTAKPLLPTRGATTGVWPGWWARLTEPASRWQEAASRQVRTAQRARRRPAGQAWEQPRCPMWMMCLAWPWGRLQVWLTPCQRRTQVWSRWPLRPSGPSVCVRRAPGRSRRPSPLSPDSWTTTDVAQPGAGRRVVNQPSGLLTFGLRGLKRLDLCCLGTLV